MKRKLDKITSLSDYLRLMREERSMSQYELAAALELSRLTVNQLENDKRNLTDDIALRYSVFFDEDVKTLMARQHAKDLARAVSYHDKHAILSRILRKSHRR